MPSDDKTGSDALTLPGRLFAALRQHGPATVIRWKRYGLWQTISGMDLAARAEAIGRGLRARGLVDGDVAAVIGDNCCEWVQADLAILAAGGVSAGLDAHCDADELARMLNLTGARVLFVAGDDQLHKALQIRTRCPDLGAIVAMHQQWNDAADDPSVLTLRDLATQSAQEAVTAPKLSPAAPAVIIVSSGSTGPARGAVLTHQAIGAQAAAGVAALGLRADDERLSLTPIHHVMERVVGVYSALLAGTVVNFSESADTALANLAELQPTVIQASPQIWAKLRAAVLMSLVGTTRLQRAACRAAFAHGEKASSAPAWQALPRMLTDWLVLSPIRSRIGLGRARLCVSTGASVQADVAAWFETIGRPLVDVYGHAETGGIVSISRAQGSAPLPGAELKLAGNDEVLVRGAALFARYVGSAEGAQLADGWWRSGDIGERDSSGRMRVVGRAAHLLAGEKGGSLRPFASEQALRASPYIADAFLSLDGAGRPRARILLDSESAVQFAQDRGIPFTHFESLCRAAEINALIAEVVAEVNRTTPAVRIATFSLIERLPRPGDPELAPMLTLRRHLLCEDDDAAAAAHGSVAV